MRLRRSFLWACAGAMSVLICSWSPAVADQHGPTAGEARAFVEAAEERLLELWIDSERAAWVQSTYITHDTEILSAQAYEKVIAASVELAKGASRFVDVEVDASDLPQFEAFISNEVRAWRFTPPTRDGRAVEARARLPIPIEIR